MQSWWAYTVSMAYNLFKIYYMEYNLFKIDSQFENWSPCCLDIGIGHG